MRLTFDATRELINAHATVPEAGVDPLTDWFVFPVHWAAGDVVLLDEPQPLIYLARVAREAVAACLSDGVSEFVTWYSLARVTLLRDGETVEVHSEATGATARVAAAELQAVWSTFAVDVGRLLYREFPKFVRDRRRIKQLRIWMPELVEATPEVEVRLVTSPELIASYDKEPARPSEVDVDYYWFYFPVRFSIRDDIVFARLFAVVPLAEWVGWLVQRLEAGHPARLHVASSAVMAWVKDGEQYDFVPDGERVFVHDALTGARYVAPLNAMIVAWRTFYQSVRDLLAEEYPAILHHHYLGPKLGSIFPE